MGLDDWCLCTRVRQVGIFNAVLAISLWMEKESNDAFTQLGNSHHTASCRLGQIQVSIDAIPYGTHLASALKHSNSDIILRDIITLAAVPKPKRPMFGGSNKRRTVILKE